MPMRLSLSAKPKVYYIFFVGLLLSFADKSVATTQEQIDTSVQYLLQNTWPRESSEDLDTNLTEQHVEVISTVLQQYNLQTEQEAAFRAIRAHALAAVNFVRFNKRQLVDISQAEQAIQDFNFAISHPGTLSIDSLQYQAGHTAKHLLQSNELALYYWHSCAERHHGGCMNILAHDYFVGLASEGANLAASVYWHRTVVNTTTDFICAGIFSAYRLAQLSYYLPDSNTGKAWSEWHHDLDKLYSKVIQELKPDAQCGMGEILSSRYVMQLVKGDADPELISRALLGTTEEAEQTVIGLLLPEQDLTMAPELLDRMLFASDRCTYAFDLAIAAKHYRNRQAFKQLEDYLSNLAQSDCQWDATLMQQLQMAGKWDF